jgi:hypothetical protein
VQGTFTGDAFGVCYPSLQTADPFIFPSTSPTDFEPEEARAAFRRIAALGGRAFLTHFGQVRELVARSKELVEWIDFSERLLHQAIDAAESDDALTGMCEKVIDSRFRQELEMRGLMGDANWELLRIDRELNAAGIAHVAVQQRKAAAEAALTKR